MVKTKILVMIQPCYLWLKRLLQKILGSASLCADIFSRNFVHSEHWLVPNQGVFDIDRESVPAESISAERKSQLMKQKGSQPQLWLNACNRDRFFSEEDEDSQTVNIRIHRRQDYHQGIYDYTVVIRKTCFSQHLLHWFLHFFPCSCRT